MSDYKKVKDYMTRNVIKVTPDMSISEIKEIIKKTGHDGFPVEQDDKIVGMITASDLLIRDLTPTVSGMMSRAYCRTNFPVGLWGVSGWTGCAANVPDCVFLQDFYSRQTAII